MKCPETWPRERYTTGERWALMASFNEQAGRVFIATNNLRTMRNRNYPAAEITDQEQLLQALREDLEAMRDRLEAEA